MLRKFFAVVVALMLAVGGLFAAEIKGIFKKYDADKATVTITVDDKDTEYKVDKTAKVKNKKSGDETLLTDVFGKWKEGQKATLTVEDGVVKSAKKDRK